MSTGNKCALAQKLRVIDEKCSEMFNEVGAKLIETVREREDRERKERERQ